MKEENVEQPKSEADLDAAPCCAFEELDENAKSEYLDALDALIETCKQPNSYESLETTRQQALDLLDMKIT